MGCRIHHPFENDWGLTNCSINRPPVGLRCVGTNGNWPPFHTDGPPPSLTPSLPGKVCQGEGQGFVWGVWGVWGVWDVRRLSGGWKKAASGSLVCRGMKEVQAHQHLLQRAVHRMHIRIVSVCTRGSAQVHAQRSVGGTANSGSIQPLVCVCVCANSNACWRMLATTSATAI
eukprot:scaffold95604_cov21-Tisochrysis_lutea.AAC.2